VLLVRRCSFAVVVGRARAQRPDGFAVAVRPRWLIPHTVKAYKTAKAPEKLIEANTQLANALAQANSFYNAGNALSGAGDAAVELNSLAAATQFYEQACQRYREGDSEKMAALVLTKAGK
jgi:hypothetical protein